MAAPETVLTVIKRFPYRGNPNEEFSNTYFLTGTTPADSAAWRALFDAFVLEEKKVLYTGFVSIIGAYGYNRPPVKGDHAVWSLDLTVAPGTPVAGTYSGASVLGSGDTAVWIRWGLDRYNEKGKRVYLRKYFHPGIAVSSAATPDLVATTWTTAATAFGEKLRDGSFMGGRRITDKLGTGLVGTASSPYLTTRTLKRRGKREAA